MKKLKRGFGRTHRSGLYFAVEHNCDGKPMLFFGFRDASSYGSVTMNGARNMACWLRSVADRIDRAEDDYIDGEL